MKIKLIVDKYRQIENINLIFHTIFVTNGNNTDISYKFDSYL